MELFQVQKTKDPGPDQMHHSLLHLFETDSKKLKELRWCFLLTSAQSFEISFQLLILYSNFCDTDT